MATKKEVRKIADRFITENPDLAHRGVRCVRSIGSGFNHYERYALVPRGPRGGLKEPVRLASGNNGSVIFTVPCGSIVMHECADNGWSSYSSFVVYPHDESSEYDQARQEEFSLDEKIASARWASKNDPDLADNGETLEYLLKLKRFRP